MRKLKALLGYSATAAIILILLGAFLLPVWRNASPVVTSEVVSATIRSLSSIPAKPNGAALGIGNYLYMIALDDGQSTAFVRDNTFNPHQVGSTIKVERQTRANGTVTFEMATRQP